jgi:hypothetical protein
VSDLLYLYGIVPAAAPPTVDSLVGIGSRPVRLIVEGDVAGVVGAVPSREFDEEPLNERMRDLEWLGPRAAAHQAVNARLMELADALVPLSFGTVYRDEAGLTRALRARHDDFVRRLEAMRGRDEWVVTLTRDEALALAALEEGSEPLRRLNEEIAASTPGRQYLLSRRLGEVQRQELAVLDEQAIQLAVLGLASTVERVYREPLAEGAAGAPIARASLLIPRARTSAFLAEVDRLDRDWRERGYSLVATGPWPPYRFGGLPLEASA